jgi:hypothetical protein
MSLKPYFVPILGMIVPNSGMTYASNSVHLAAFFAAVVAFSATACAPVQTKPTPPRTVERVVYVPIPADLTEPLPVYQRTRETFGEAWKQAEINTSTLARCNADRAAVEAIQGSPRD